LADFVEHADGHRRSACALVLDQPHQPTARDSTQHKEDEAECPEPNHHPRFSPLRNPENNRCK
jgi:hypothetical protein